MNLTKIVVTALVLSIAVVTCAISAKAQEVAAVQAVQAVPQAATAYIDVLRSCGAKWKGRSDKADNKGREAWQAFRRACVLESGYTVKRPR